MSCQEVTRVRHGHPDSQQQQDQCKHHVCFSSRWTHQISCDDVIIKLEEHHGSKCTSKNPRLHQHWSKHHSEGQCVDKKATAHRHQQSDSQAELGLTQSLTCWQSLHRSVNIKPSNRGKKWHSNPVIILVLFKPMVQRGTKNKQTKKDRFKPTIQCYKTHPKMFSPCDKQIQ